MLTPEDLDRLDELRKAATPLPWVSASERRDTGSVSYGHVCTGKPSASGGRPMIVATGFVDDYWSEKWGPRPVTQPGNVNVSNAEFIVAACNANEALVAGYREMEAEVRRLRAENEELSAAVAGFRDIAAGRLHDHEDVRKELAQ